MGLVFFFIWVIVVFIVCLFYIYIVKHHSVEELFGYVKRYLIRDIELIKSIVFIVPTSGSSSVVFSHRIDHIEPDENAILK